MGVSTTFVMFIGALVVIRNFISFNLLVVSDANTCVFTAVSVCCSVQAITVTVSGV